VTIGYRVISEWHNNDKGGADAEGLALLKAHGVDVSEECSLVRYENGIPTAVIHSDGGEPEDQTLFRDKLDLVDELNRLAGLLNKAGEPCQCKNSEP
jgi:hypothetical protein